MQKRHIALITSLMIVVFVVGLGFGYYLTPTYKQTMYQNDQMDLGTADRFVDLRYINQMITHHRGAVLLAEQIDDKTNRPEIQSLAKEIQTNEPKLIDELYSWKKAWYNDVGKVADPSVAHLGTKDETVDLRFLNALIAHHEDGIKMTKEIRVKSSRKEILDNADAVENFLKESSVTLTNWRMAWYANK